MTLHIWGRANSINVQKVLWTCAELSLEYHRFDVGGAFGGLDVPRFLAMNPNGRVPALEDGDLAIWESNAIVRYLAARYGTGRLWADDPVRRAKSDMWMDWSLSTFWPAVRPLFLQLVRTPHSDRDHRVIAESHAAACEAARILEGTLGQHDFLGGRELGIGDIAVGVVASRWFALDIEHPAVPASEAWHDRLRGRAAFAATVPPALS